MSLSLNARLVRSLAAATAVAGAAGAATAAPQPQTSAAPAPKKAAAPAPKPAPLPKLPANVFARIGGQDITGTELVAFLSRLGGYPLVQQRVQIAVAEQQAKKFGVSISPAELDKAVQDAKDNIVKSQMMQSTQPMTFEEIAAKQGINEGLIREQTRFQLLLKKTYSKVAEGNVPSIQGRIRVSHLLISTQPAPADMGKPDTPEAQAKRDADALAKVKQIQADIASGKITWQAAIKQYSQDPSAQQNNGDLGWVGPDTPFVPEFKDAAFKIQKVGDIAGPVKSQFGYHLIRLDAKGSEATAAQKAQYKKEQIDQQLANPQAIQVWFAGLVRSANVVYNPTAKLSAAAAPAAASTPARPAATTRALRKK